MTEIVKKATMDTSHAEIEAAKILQKRLIEATASTRETLVYINNRSLFIVEICS